MNDQQIAFICAANQGGCGARFKTNDYRTDDYPERHWYPLQHFAICPKCGDDQCPQAGWQLAQWKAVFDHGRTGPISAEGIAAISKANQSRDQSTYAISRFNAITHGAYAETAKFYPARPGKYDLCEGCEYLNNGCGTELQHCGKRTELFVQFALAQESGDGRLLGRLMASTQAGLQAIIADMIRSIAARGVELERPMFVKGDNGIHLARYVDKETGEEHIITEVSAHPLLKPLIEFIHKNGMTLTDLALTPAKAEEEKRFNGYLDDKAAEREQLEKAQSAQRDQMDQLMQLIGRGAKTITNGGRVIDGESEAD